MSPDLEGARCDEESARLLPWYVAGRLAPSDFERVSTHLEHCAICRADVAHERAVRELMKADTPVEFAPQTGLAKTLLRIDELSHDASNAVAPIRGPGAAARRRVGALQWLTAAVILQTVALGWLGVSMRHRPGIGRRRCALRDTVLGSAADFAGTAYSGVVRTHDDTLGAEVADGGQRLDDHPGAE